MSLVEQSANIATLTTLEEREKRLNWFNHARYGLFIHWGLYSLIGRGEWVRNREQVPQAEYWSLANQFRAESFNAREWADFAVSNGMKYAVLTTKHHDGFCLWNSKTCRFNSMHSAAGRDLVGEFVQACHEAGLKVGLYYSLGDWDNPDWIRAAEGDESAEGRFIDYTHRLVEELVTQYGRIDIMWYDLPQALSPAQWRSHELNQMVRKNQPHIIINNRSMLPEDFSIAEQNLHGTAPGRKWEACLTLNDSWAYVNGDLEFKSPRTVARALAQVTANGGNLLLNVGPKGDGSIPQESRAILETVGKWLERVGEAIYLPNTGKLPFNLWGTTSVVGNHIYIFLERYFGSELVIGGLTNRILDADLLGTDSLITWEQKGNQTILRGLPTHAPDPVLTVLKLELDGIPDQSISRAIAGADIMARFPD